MNKKFSTLMTAGLLMVGALFSSANAADPTPKSVTVDLAKSADLGKYYYIGLPAAAGEEGSEYLKALEVTNTTAGVNMKMLHSPLWKAKMPLALFWMIICTMICICFRLLQ